MSEIRWDPWTRRSVVIAASRSSRPNEYVGGPPLAGSPADCPFCEGHEDRTPPEIASVRPRGGQPNGPGWTVRLIPNKFPTLASGDSTAELPGGGLSRAAGEGRHEVLIESPRHAPGLPELPPTDARAVFRFLRDRVRELTGESGTAAVIAFENVGPESGGTLWHPHAQIVAAPFVPSRIAEELAHSGPGEGAGCRLEAARDAELEDGLRSIAREGPFVAWAPFASAHPFSVRILSSGHAPSFGNASDAEVNALAGLVPHVLRAFLAVVPQASYNWAIASLPPTESTAGYHWRWELTPRLVRPDGFELAGEMPVNPVAPESAAERLRSVWVRSERSE
jgi:UDPglucose--hexose-1-phosphate uridylyltransferase